MQVKRKDAKQIAKLEPGSPDANEMTLRVSQNTVENHFVKVCLSGNVLNKFLWSSIHPTEDILAFYFTHFCIP